MKPRDLAQTTFSVLVIGALIAASFWILRPFLGPAIWATMVVVATWPVMLRVEARLRGRRWAAVAVMTLLLLLLFVVPLTLALVTLVDNADRIVGWAKTLASLQVPPAPPPPVWVVPAPPLRRIASILLLYLHA